MDYDETEMNEDEFDARWSTGRPAEIAQTPRDPNRRSHGFVTRVTDSSRSVVIQDNHFAGEYEIKAPSVA